MNGQMVAWDRKKLDQLREAHSQAARERQDSFVLTLKPEGEIELVTSYARYLLQYLDSEFASHPDQPAQPNREGQEGD